MDRTAALSLLQKYNQEPFHILHALTVEGVMKWYACELGYGGDADWWGLVGLLHDVDFEKYPEEHCKRRRLSWRKSTHRPGLSMPFVVTVTVFALTSNRST